MNLFDRVRAGTKSVPNVTRACERTKQTAHIFNIHTLLSPRNPQVTLGTVPRNSRPGCKHVTDPELVAFYDAHPELTCAKCFHEGVGLVNGSDGLAG